MREPRVGDYIMVIAAGDVVPIAYICQTEEAAIASVARVGLRWIPIANIPYTTYTPDRYGITWCLSSDEECVKAFEVAQALR